MRVNPRLHSPIEGMRLGDGSVQATGGPVADQLEQQHHAVAGLLGHSQVDALPRLGGYLDDGIRNSGRVKREIGVRGNGLCVANICLD